jgi:hypothetical protein
MKIIDVIKIQRKEAVKTKTSIRFALKSDIDKGFYCRLFKNQVKFCSITFCNYLTCVKDEI